MEKRKGRRVNLICGRCKKQFDRPAATIRSEQKDVFCSRECLKKTPEEKKATQEKCRILWREKNRDKAILQAKEWKLRNPERNKELKRIGYHRNAEKINARRKVWNKENRERVVERQKAYYRKNKQRIDAYARRYAKSNPERIKESRQRHWEKNRVSVFWSRAKKAAKEKGIKFDITKDWFKVRLDAGVCEMSGLPFDMKGKRSDNSPTIDRIKPAGDYTMDNCRMVLWSISRALSNCGEDYMIKVFRAIIEKKATWQTQK